jgi:hypothetical protein
MANALILLRRRRRDIGHLRRAPRTPVAAGGDQRKRRASVCPADRLRKQPHSAAVLQDLAGKGVQSRFGISGVELCDDHHTLPPFVFIALTPVLGPYTLLLASPPVL